MRSSRSSRAAAIAYPNDADGADGGGLLRRAAGWIAAAALADLAIRRGRVTAHREWMTRSYIVTFSFVTFRWWADLGLLHGLARDSVAVLIFLSWSLPLLAAEIVIRARKARTNRGSVRNRMRGSRIP